MFPLAEHKGETAAMGELQATVKALNSELGDRVGDIQKQDKLFKDLQISQVRYSSVQYSMIKVTKLFARELWWRGWLGERLPSKPSLTRKGT